MKPNLPHLMRKKQYFILLFFGIAILFYEVGFFFFKSATKNTFVDAQFISSKENSVIIEDFNPNQFDEKQWQNIGFSERQAKTILKYKEILGGSFSSKEELKKCYVISEEKFQELSSHILLPEKSVEKEFQKNYFNEFKDKELTVLGKFNPDLYAPKDWQKMGFSEKQAAAIVKYKEYLGGSFVSKEKFRECFIINEKNYQKLAPHLILPEKTPENFQKFQKNFAQEKPKIQYFEFDPNLLNQEGWQKLGFTEKQAAVIVNYRDKNLKGSFKSLEDIQKCFVISAEKFANLKSFIKLTVPENKENTVISKPAKEEIAKTDFSKTDLNKITFAQLIEFGFDEKSAAGFIGFRNKLGGYVNKKQILEIYNIDKEIAEKLIQIATLHNENIEKYTLTKAPEDWLKNHPYFRYYANKIIYFRLEYPSESMILQKIKAKPEDVEKMRLYLKKE